MFLDRMLSHPLPQERVIFYLRRHWFIFAKQAALYLLLAAAPLALAWLLPRYLPTLWEFLSDGGLTQMLVHLGLSVYYLGVWMFFWHAWTDYYLDVWLVTNERVMSLEQRGLFNRRVAELRLSRVQDVAAHVAGFVATAMDFGEVRVQTAGEEPNFIFHDVPRPNEISQKVLHLADDWRHAHNEPVAGYSPSEP